MSAAEAGKQGVVSKEELALVWMFTERLGIRADGRH
jgi:hypothetical protein